MKLSYLKKIHLADKPGIYMFLDVDKKPIYIGRATSLKDRVRSYFSNDVITTRGPRIIDMVTKARSLKTMEFDSVLETVIQEGNLIRKYQPRYNVDDKDDKSSQYIVITDETLPRVFTERVRDFDVNFNNKSLDYKVKKVFGPYPHSGLIKEALKIIRKIFPFRDKKSINRKHEQFYISIGRSPDISTEDKDQIKNYNKTINYLINFFEGKKSQIEKGLIVDMNNFADNLDFENANRAKRMMYAIKHINDIALIKKDLNFRESANMRIEAYDIAHISGKQKVGAMTVISGGEISKKDQRFFKIKDETNDDIVGLAEILIRRLRHSEWQFPDLIVVDGGTAQLNIAKNILSANRFAIPVVAVTKDDKHKANEIIGDKNFAIKFKEQIISINAEVHRVAIGYHRRRMRNRIHDVI